MDGRAQTAVGANFVSNEGKEAKSEISLLSRSPRGRSKKRSLPAIVVSLQFYRPNLPFPVLHVQFERISYVANFAASSREKGRCKIENRDKRGVSYDYFGRVVNEVWKQKKFKENAASLIPLPLELMDC